MFDSRLVKENYPRKLQKSKTKASPIILSNNVNHQDQTYFIKNFDEKKKVRDYKNKIKDDVENNKKYI